MKKRNPSFLLLTVLMMSMTGCTVYVSPDSATITKRRPIPAADPSYTSPAAIPTTTTTTTKKTVITEIQDTPIIQPSKTSTTTKSTTPKTVLQPTQTLYTVKPKDTVFSIMRKTNANWSDIIRINSLEPPNYTIHPGQVLRLK